MPDEAAKTRKKRGAGATQPAEGATKAKPQMSARELVFMVSRAAAGFEAMLKTKDPALSLSQWTILEMLAQDDGDARPSQIARKLGFSRQLVRQATKKLTTLELIAKDTPEEGKKAVGLTLTDAGRKALAEIGVSTDAMSETLKADKRGGGVNQAARTLKSLSAAMAAHAPSGTKRRGKKGAAEPGETTEPAEVS